MNNALDQILQIILNGGVLGSCGALCSQLPNQLEQVACNLLCDYVGIESFIDLVNYEDPDPIYICQVFDMCAEVDNGLVTINKTIIAPAKVCLLFKIEKVYFCYFCWIWFLNKILSITIGSSRNWIHFGNDLHRHSSNWTRIVVRLRSTTTRHANGRRRIHRGTSTRSLQHPMEVEHLPIWTRKLVFWNLPSPNGRVWGRLHQRAPIRRSLCRYSRIFPNHRLNKSFLLFFKSKGREKKQILFAQKTAQKKFFL